MSPYSLPNPPTDNLYKFCAISGLIILIFTSTFTSVYSNKLKDDIIDFEAMIEIQELESNYISKDLQNLENKEQKIINILGSINYDSLDFKIYNDDFNKSLTRIKQDKNWRDYLEFRYKYIDEIIPTKKKYNEYKSLLEEVNKKNKKLNLNFIEITRNKNKINEKYLFLKRLRFLFFVLVTFGIILSYYGFKKWKNNVQSQLDEVLKLELEKLKTEQSNTKLKNSK